VQTRQTVRRAGFPLAATIAIIVIVVILVASAVAFLPVQPVNFNQSNEATAANVDSLKLTVIADIANVNVMLRDLPGNQRAAVNVSATGAKSIFGSDHPLDLSFNKSTQGSTLVYSVIVSRTEPWLIFNTLDVSCDVYVDPSVNLTTSIESNTGTIMLNADQEATFQSLILQTNTGSIEANITQAVTISGDFSLHTTTGSVHLTWDNPRVAANIPVDVTTTTGSVYVNLTQNRRLEGNVTLNAETTTGSVNLEMNIQGDVGARISASTTMGGVNVQQQGFSGDQVPIQSNNYPAASNFDVNLRTTTGSVGINAVYGIGGTRS